ncbi:hypothetical protein BHAOGJBA_2896 [Methylobacterium hispanicum]|uniref:Methyltransferase type 12 n=1 Tax=Methylobacterium hispanicum TaxID=270350 RepID=A0AAV4ZN64_9HYPH|nr:hypothetical protein BHAOGJBA_2896 [Methylobacterium hispanicum]
MVGSSQPLLRSRTSRMSTPVPSVLPGSAAPPPVVLPIPSERVLTEGEIVIRNDLFTMLDGFAHDVGPRGHTAVARDVLHALGGFRSRIGEEAWLASGVPLAREHAIFGILQEDPITSHSFTRPRGYPGDAGLLDLMYGHEAVSARVASASEIGRAINAYTVNADMCESVRLRRGILAGAIDDAAARRPGASVLVVACGHLREAEVSVALREGRIGRLLATDQDENSLAVVAGYAKTISPAVEPMKLSVRDFISGKRALGTFDLVYAAGLYDYLDDRISARLTRKLFALLNPGGRAIVANFLGGRVETAYMEAYMNWSLIYRTREQIEGFAAEISEVDVASRRYFEDAVSCVGYLELERA